MNIDYYMSLEYPVVTIPSQYTDGSPSVTATYPDIPGCRGQGDTEELAIADLVEARRALFEVLIEEGHDIPAPSIKIGEGVPIVVTIPEPSQFEQVTYSDSFTPEPIEASVATSA
jgi:predicted RNase H-like HicB family nuclease